MIILPVQQGFPLAQIIRQSGTVQVADVQNSKALEGLVQPHDVNLLRLQRQLLVHAPVGQAAPERPATPPDASIFPAAVRTDTRFYVLPKESPPPFLALVYVAFLLRVNGGFLSKV